MNNLAKGPLFPVTNSGPKPGDFPIGSVESRAAARALVERQTEEKEVLRTEVVYIAAKASELPPSSRREYEDFIIEMVYMNSDGYVSPFA